MSYRQHRYAVVESAEVQKDTTTATAEQTNDSKPLAGTDTASQNSPTDLHGPAVVGVAASEMRNNIRIEIIVS